WMKVEQIVNWVSSFYPAWDNAFTERLLDVFRLPRSTKVKALSKGQNSSLALLLALGHRPKVVILDDPTLGLDPIARKDFLRHIIDLCQTNGVTVFFSSHLLYEIEPVADHIAIIDRGVIVKAGRTEQLRENIRRFVFRPLDNWSPARIGGLLDVTKSEGSVSVVVEGCDDDKRALLKAVAAEGIQEIGLNLDEIFEACVVGNRGEAMHV
ncbi:MAG TPA: AAA family ATPase, partial [Sedimentisphaerales bacterium]|nr:AAA family ATPase [Sedimentisphaerales bacterium]